MRAAVYGGVGQPLRIEQVPDPQPGPGDLVVRVRDCGICGSDLHLSDSGFAAPGLVMGHEFSGEITEVGPEAGGEWRVGDPVCALPARGCGHCAPCAAGDVMECAALRTTGLGEAAGAYAEYVVTGTRETFRLPEGVDHRLGALVEPLAVGLHAVEAGRLVPGDDVLVVGAGPVGVTVALWARLFGARHVVASDPVAQRRELAGAHGASHAIDPGAEKVLPAFERIAGRPPSVIFECVGVPGLLQHCIGVAPRHGRIVVVGVCMEQDTLFPASAVMKELSFHCVAFYRKRDFALTLDMLRSGRLSPGGLVTDVIDLTALPEAFESLKRPTTQCKVLVEP